VTGVTTPPPVSRLQVVVPYSISQLIVLAATLCFAMFPSIRLLCPFFFLSCGLVKKWLMRICDADVHVGQLMNDAVFV
jgi:hypothetical protein